MIKARFIKKEANGEEVSVVLLALEERNIILLKEGKPIFVNLRELGIVGEVILAYGETQKNILDDLRAHGLLQAIERGGTA